MKTDHIVTQLFLQQWRKMGEKEANFALTPQECVKKFRRHTFKDIGSALLIAFAVILAIAVPANHIISGNGFISVIYAFGAVLSASLFKAFKPGKRSVLTTNMRHSWRELSKGLHRHGLLYQDDNVNETDFAELVTEKLRTYLASISLAENREEEEFKSKFKKRLVDLHTLCSRLNLKVPRYEELYEGNVTIQWIDPRKTTPTIKVILRPADHPA